MNPTKNRLWQCTFFQTSTADLWPQVFQIVQEREFFPYNIPLSGSPRNFPENWGGQLTLVLQGRGVAELAGKPIKLTANHAFIYNHKDRQVRYYVPPDQREEWLFVWVHFRGAAAEKMIEKINQRWGYIFDLKHDSTLAELLLSYKKFAGRALYLTETENALLALQIVNLLLQNRETVSAAERLGALPIATIRQDLSYVDKISDLAPRLQLSRSHLSRRYREATGETLQNFRQRTRLNQAMELLLKTTLTSEEIADKVGYNSYSSFYRAFVKAFNFSPLHFRKNAANS